ncbi:uncharacterized protein [Amphiura filiformis]|uniref:uncharacterized protein isoform X1 n=1 Tax=Amphiura filiformis TaxID=82378 RepID=UPI003B20FB74
MSSTRNRFTDEQRAILKEYWDKGMKSSGTQEAKKMVQEVMAKTRLEKKQVQNWIKNQKEKKDKEEGVVRERRKPFNVSTITSNATTSRAQLLHRAFRANYLRSKDQSTDEKKKEALKEMAKEWERVKKNEEELKKVEEIVDEEADEQALSSKERMSRVKAITKEITKLCNHLKEEYSYESAFVTARADHGHMATGSTMGIQFLTRNNFEVIRNFTYSVGGRVEGGISNLDDTVRAGLVSSVQMLFNKRYEKVLKKKKQVEYKKIKEGQIKVTTISFPDGLEFKKPGSYSLEDLRRIIQAADEENLKIHFEKTENEREDGPVSDLNSQPEGATTQSYIKMKQVWIQMKMKQVWMGPMKVKMV